MPKTRQDILDEINTYETTLITKVVNAGLTLIEEPWTSRTKTIEIPVALTDTVLSSITTNLTATYAGMTFNYFPPAGDVLAKIVISPD